MTRELELINTLASNPFLETSTVSKIFEEISKELDFNSDSLNLRAKLSNKDFFADVQADGMQ